MDTIDVKTTYSKDSKGAVIATQVVTHASEVDVAVLQQRRADIISQRDRYLADRAAQITEIDAILAQSASATVMSEALQ